jgi:hypothetical protein
MAGGVILSFIFDCFSPTGMRRAADNVRRRRKKVTAFCFFHKIQNVPTSNFSKDQNLIGFSFSSLFFGVIASNVGR